MNNFSLIKYFVINSQPDYVAMIISGLFGIALLSVTVFSISISISYRNFVISLSSLKRYKILFLFFPLILLFGFIFLNIYFNLEVIYVFIEALIILAIIIIQSSLILEPFYNIDKFKRSLLASKVNIMKKRAKKNPIDIEKENINELKNLLNNNNTSWTYDELKNCYIKYIMFADEFIYSDQSQNKIIDIGYKYFGNDLLDMYPNIRNISLENIINYFLKANSKVFNEQIFTFIFDKLQYLLSDNLESFNTYFEDFASYILRKPKYFQATINYIFKEKWTIKDASYIKIYIKLVLHENVRTLIKYFNLIKMNTDVGDKYTYLKECFTNNEKLSKKYGENIDDLLQTCFVLIRKEREDEKKDI